MSRFFFYISYVVPWSQGLSKVECHVTMKMWSSLMSTIILKTWNGMPLQKHDIFYGHHIISFSQMTKIQYAASGLSTNFNKYKT